MHITYTMDSVDPLAELQQDDSYQHLVVGPVSPPPHSINICICTCMYMYMYVYLMYMYMHFSAYKNKNHRKKEFQLLKFTVLLKRFKEGGKKVPGNAYPLIPLDILACTYMLVVPVLPGA